VFGASSFPLGLAALYAVVSDNEAVEVQIETILHRRAVNFRNQAARLRKSVSINTHTVADGNQFLWRVS
jgi:hypothetical protein